MSANDPRETARRRLAYRRELSKIGGPFEYAAWVFTLTGLCLILARRLLDVDLGVYRPMGVFCLIGALGCWLIVYIRRREWQKANPFRG